MKKPNVFTERQLSDIDTQLVEGNAQANVFQEDLVVSHEQVTSTGRE